MSENNAKYFVTDLFPESDKVVMDAGRFIFGSHDGAKISSDFGHKNWDLYLAGAFFDLRDCGLWGSIITYMPRYGKNIDNIDNSIIHLDYG